MTIPTVPLTVASFSRRLIIPSTAFSTHPPYCRNSSTVRSTHCASLYAATSESKGFLLRVHWYCTTPGSEVFHSSRQMYCPAAKRIMISP
ncbi:hypothetical protein BO221_32230 [Archangium sp. Cb G35]|nr:hypothetical protein BO221_32230 [Archangium sp. Cb G35]